MAAEFSHMSALDLLRLMRTKQVSPVAVVESALRHAEAVQPTLNTFVTITPDLALKAARRAEQAIMAGKDGGILCGLPVSIKDLTALKGVRFTSGSRTSADFIAPVDAPAAERVKQQGACIIGKTTTTEFGCKASSSSPLTGTTLNPWNLTRTPGGSSSGAGASVAAGVTPFALGTDGGGSIRIPASFCGLFGIKAHFGRVPIFPTSATPTLAHVGPLARTVRDAALLLGVISGWDARDPAAVAADTPDYLAACERSPKGLRIAWSPTLGYAKPMPEVVRLAEAQARALEGLGCEVELVENVFDDPAELWMAEFYAGVGTRLKETLQKDSAVIDPAVVELLRPALDQRLEDYYARVFQRYEFREKVRTFFERYDALLTPATPTPAFDVTRDMPAGFEGRDIVSWVAYTYPFNLCGLPAASVPCGLTQDGLPVGLQIVSRPLRETDVFCLAASLEAARPWSALRPAVH